MAAFKLESFRWTDYSILIMINTLQSSDKHDKKLAKRLNQLYDAAEAENRVLGIATVQQEIRSFWRVMKENWELTFKGTNKGGGIKEALVKTQRVGGKKEEKEE